MRSSPRIVVGSAPRARTGSVVMLLSGALLAGGALGYFIAAASSAPVGEERVVSAERDVAAAQAELSALRQDLAIARRGGQVTEEANELLRRQIFDLESEIAGLEADVAFYKRLLGTGGSLKGLAVHALQLIPTSSARVHRYQLTLSQNLNKAKVVRGRYRLAVEGVRDGQMVTLDAAALQLKPQPSDSVFEFKYFQQLSGSLRLPEGFEPESMIVRLDADEAKKPVERRFDWSDLRDLREEQQEEAHNVQSEG